MNWIDFRRLSTAPAGCRPRAQAGLSLIELMVTISVGALLMSLGAPSFVQAMRLQEIRAAQNELAAALQLAEIEASRRGTAVVMLRRDGCGRPLSGQQDWSCGYLLFGDRDGDGNQDGDEPSFKAVEVSSRLSLQHLAGGLERLQMNPWGKATGGAHRFVMVSATSGGAVSGTVCLNLGGQVQLLKGDVSCP
jgi:type IV fimbrial biogenesis protein FimT